VSSTRIAAAGLDGSPGLSTERRLAAWAGALHRIHSGLVHDVRSPLGGVSINLLLLSDKFADLTPDQPPRKHLEAALASLARVKEGLATLGGALDLSGKPGPFDLGAALADVGAWVDTFARAQQNTVRVSRPDREVRIADGRDHLRQALVHLALRGLELAGENGGVVLELEAVGPGAGPAILHVRIPGESAVVAQPSEDVAVAGALIGALGGRLAIEPGNVGSGWRIELPCLDSS